ncbi:MAG: UDP-2,3-diacylglucosamine diphosphatase [Steroidobacteraceae bacterium]
MTTLFISDLHLDAAAPDAAAQFLDFLAGPARAADALYVLGDLFEAWVGDDDDDPWRARICAALRALAAGGVDCHVMHGNRDFLLQRGFAARSGCHLLGDPTVIELGGERALLTHGDALCTDDAAYQRLRGVVRQPARQRRFLGAAARHAPRARRRRARRQPPAHATRRADHHGRERRRGARRAARHRRAHADPRPHAPPRRARIRAGRRAGAPHRARRVVRTGSVLAWRDGRYALETLPRGGPE